MDKIAQKIITYSFYLLFFLVPLIFYSGSRELFEYNKMMLTYGITIIIACAWTVKTIITKKASFTKSAISISLILYLASHFVSTIFSIDPHVSFWGYYTRFHEGLLSSICYVFLFFVAVDILDRKNVFYIFIYSLIAGVIVSLWGAMEHYGGSPSCYFITGNLDVSCWIQDVQARVFATLGQPNWMAAYLNILILTTIGLVLTWKDKTAKIVLVMLGTLFFAGLLFTKSRSGILGLGAGMITMSILIMGRQIITKAKEITPNSLLTTISLAILFSLTAIYYGLPLTGNSGFSLEEKLKQDSTKQEIAPKPKTPSGYIDIGITESGDIRKIVWEGAVKIWQRYPIIGSGVETFAYSYYQDRPSAHNMTSEWDFLYNKAHNEYLNILATTGTLGILAYLAIHVSFILYVLKTVLGKTNNPWLTISLFGAWTSIIVTNFFGFSVVIVGLYFFLIPAFVLILNKDKAETSEEKQKELITQKGLHKKETETSPLKIGTIIIILITGIILETRLINMWQADASYAYGKNLQEVGQYARAYPYLSKAIEMDSNEPSFRDDLAYNQAILASGIYSQIKSSSEAAALSKDQQLNFVIPEIGLSTQALINLSVENSNYAITKSPYAIPFWKSRTRLFYQLSTIDPAYLPHALQSIETAAKLAPTDAKIQYNYGYLLGQNGLLDKAINVFETTTKLKADYRDAFYALGLYYKEKGDLPKARAQMLYILTRIGPDKDAQEFLEKN